MSAPARRRAVAAALALASAIALADCDDPAPAWAECFPSFRAPTACEADPRVDAPIPSTPTTSPVVVDVTPPAVMPESVSVPASPVTDVAPPTSVTGEPPAPIAYGALPAGLPEVCGRNGLTWLTLIPCTPENPTIAQACADPQYAPHLDCSEVPALPVTGAAELVEALVALGFVLVGATLVGPLARRRGGAR